MITRRTFLATAAVTPFFTVPVAAAQDAVSPEIIVEHAISYGEVDGKRLLLDAYRPPVRDLPRPAMIVLPGWGGGRDYVAPNAAAMAAAGYVAFVADYRLSFETFASDAHLALSWVRENAATYGVDPERVGSYGHSAGGQLAVMLGIHDVADPSNRVACAVSVAGIGDVTVMETDPERLAVAAGIVGMPQEDLLAVLRDQSPAALVDDKTAPAMLLHGGLDDVLSPDQSRNLSAALQSAEVETAFVYFPEETHVPIIRWELGGGLVLAFLEQHLRPSH
jgi:dipeptidyl aminopeptidase/acylaminoacyl peptidase